MASVVVIGAQWGDEGKGKVVDILSEFADFTVRFQGGSNAGHTLVLDGQKTVLHLLPCGVFHRGKRNVIANGVVIDPEVLASEIGFARGLGLLERTEALAISESAHLVMPWHRRIDELREERAGRNSIGTTRRGIGPAYEDKVGRRGIRVGDLMVAGRFTERVAARVAEVNEELAWRYGEPPMDADAITAAYLGHAEVLRAHVTDTSLLLHQALEQGRNVLFEGAQGTLLDVDHGTYPYVTSSTTVAAGACAGSGIGPTRITAVIGVSKAYTTRVGEGPFPTELRGEQGRLLRERGQEYGATTGRPRRCGWLDVVALRHAVRVNGLTSLSLTKLDVLSGLRRLKICVAYKADGVEHADIPFQPEVLERCTPVYEDLPGFEGDLSHVRLFDDLPSQARRYVGRIEDLLGCEVVMLGVGPNRSEAAMKRNPFR